MNKQCKACGAVVPTDARFCQACGNSEFIMSNSAQSQASYNQHQCSQQSSAHQTWQPPVPQKQPKKKKTGLIIGIVAAVLVVLAAIGMIAEKSFQDQGYGSNYDNNSDISDNNFSGNSSSNNESEKIYYSKGNFDGSVYINRWADIEFALPEGFSNADLATYSAAENSNTECGAYFIADDTMSLIYICFEKLPTFPVYDEEEYLDAATKALQNVSGVTYQIPDTYSSANIAGYSYVKADCQFNNGNGDFVQTIYVRKLDNYIIFVSAIGINAESNDALVNNITKVN